MSRPTNAAMQLAAKAHLPTNLLIVSISQNPTVEHLALAAVAIALDKQSGASAKDRQGGTNGVGVEFRNAREEATG